MTDAIGALEAKPVDADPGRDRADGRSIYLDVFGTPTYAVLHSPAGDALPSDTAVLVCPPFGFDEVCAYRILREWAIRLAQAGHSALRLTYPSCGDSGATPRDPDRLGAWTESVSVAATTLRACAGVNSVIAIGLGLGGLLAYRAAGVGAPIDGLVLWAAPARGREFIRQLKALSRLESTEFFKDLPQHPPPRDGELEAGGFLLGAQTVSDLSALDLTALDLPRGLPRGALLLERDGIAVDARLRNALERRGVEDPPLYEPGFLRQVTAGIDFISDGGFAQRVAIVGLRAGAYWAVHVGMADVRVAACLLVNPRAFVFYDGMDAARDMRRALAEPLTVQRIRHNVTRARVAGALRLLATLPGRQLARFRSGPPAFVYGTELDALLVRMRDSAPPLTVLFAAREPLDEELEQRGQLERMADWPSFTLSRVAVHDHTLRPIWAQEQAHAILGQAMSDRFELNPGAPGRARMTNNRRAQPPAALHCTRDVLGWARRQHVLEGARPGPSRMIRGRRLTGVTVDAEREQGSMYVVHRQTHRAAGR
jgi:hypothetical protein